ncbi:MAG: hypothetical protein GYA15_07190 [Leptolinea sp.]|nr:hypothetical protein [Leptolinea sp.]
MNSIEPFLQLISGSLTANGYVIQTRPVLEGVRGVLYARSPQPYSLLITKIIDHFLFLSWDDKLFGRQDQLIVTYKSFNRYVNRQFTIPHWMRMTIPNMALIVLSESGFDEDTLKFAQSTFMVPFKGGEVGQFFLIDLKEKSTICHRAYAYKQYGAAPLYHTQNFLLSIINGCLQNLNSE